MGSLFAVVLNQRAAEAIFGRSENLTLVDRLHLTTMTYILIAIAIAVFSGFISERGQQERGRRINRIGAYFAGISFLVVNFILIIHAKIIG